MCLIHVLPRDLRAQDRRLASFYSTRETNEWMQPNMYFTYMGRITGDDAVLTMTRIFTVRDWKYYTGP